MFALLCCCGCYCFSSCLSPSVVAFLLLLLLLLFLQLLLPLLLSSLMLLFVSLASVIHLRWRQCFSISPLQRVATTTIPFPFQALLIPSLPPPPQQRLADGLRQRRVECHQAYRPLPRRPALRHDGEEEREGGGGRGGGVAAGIGGHYGDILSHGQQAKSHTSKYFI